MTPNSSSEEWNEFEWEQALRESDQYAFRYVRLLQRFNDLPGANDLIAEHMSRESNDVLPTCDFDCDNCEKRWTCEFAMPHDWMMGEIPDFSDPDDDVRENPFGGSDEEIDAEGGLAYEKDGTFALLRRTTLGWSNVYAAVLTPDQRPVALRALYHLGRALGSLAYTLEEADDERAATGVAFLKRALQHLNAALGHLAELGQETGRQKRLIGTIRGYLLTVREGLLNHLQKYRSALNNSDG